MAVSVRKRAQTTRLGLTGTTHLNRRAESQFSCNYLKKLHVRTYYLRGTPAVAELQWQVKGTRYAGAELRSRLREKSTTIFFVSS